MHLVHRELECFMIVFQVLHGAERGETAALILSPLKSTFKDNSGSDFAKNGSQFTFFLTAPLQAFCQMVGCVSSNDSEVCLGKLLENLSYGGLKLIYLPDGSVSGCIQ